jgi:Protein of unknown function (DUF2380)
MRRRPAKAGAVRSSGAKMRLTQLFSFANPLTILFASALAWPFAGWPATAAEKAAVFDFELMHGSLVPGAPNPREAEEKRLKLIGDRLRDHLAKSGRFTIVDIAPVAAKAAAANLQACGDCADTFAHELGANYAFTGFVHKVSELILSMNVYVHETATSASVASASVDMRGNTDESWRRGIDYLYENVLSPRLEKMK